MEQRKSGVGAWSQRMQEYEREVTMAEFVSMAKTSPSGEPPWHKVKLVVSKQPGGARADGDATADGGAGRDDDDGGGGGGAEEAEAEVLWSRAPTEDLAVTFGSKVQLGGRNDEAGGGGGGGGGGDRVDATVSKPVDALELLPRWGRWRRGSGRVKRRISKSISKRAPPQLFAMSQ